MRSDAIEAAPGQRAPDIVQAGACASAGEFEGSGDRISLFYHPAPTLARASRARSYFSDLVPLSYI